MSSIRTIRRAWAGVLGLAILSWAGPLPGRAAEPERPSILLAIADDWSWPHASAYGCRFVKTPAFDRTAREGVLFNNAFCASPGCSPSRAALLTGRPTWQLEHAGTHASSFPRSLQVYPDLLEKAGYHVGTTGKGWGPGNFRISGWPRSPAGPAYSAVKTRPPQPGISGTDYAACFEAFLQARPEGAPFCFWYGATEPHRPYHKGAGRQAGKKLTDVDVPPLLPDVELIRDDLLDYAVEVEWFDRHLGRMLEILEKRGELDRTLVVVCSDNGMPFPAAKANLHEYGIHMPLAIRWPARVKGGRVVEDLVSHIDLAPTFLEAAGIRPPREMAGRSLLGLLTSGKEGQVERNRDRVFAARERHSSARVMNLGYPARALRTHQYLYIRNFAPERWPAGDPRGVAGAPFGYYDIDGCPSKTFLIEQKDVPAVRPFFLHATAKRPPQELYDIRTDPGCLRNLADEPGHASTRKSLADALEKHLRQTGDARVLGNGEIWESYPRYSPIRKFE